jgi:hypothetical protein
MESGVTLFGLTGNCFVSNEVFKEYFENTWQKLQQSELGLLKAKITVENHNFNLVFSLQREEDCDLPLSSKEFKMFLENEVNRAIIEDDEEVNLSEDVDLNLLTQPYMWDILDHTEEVGLPYRLGCDLVVESSSDDEESSSDDEESSSDDEESSSDEEEKM